MTPSIQFPPFTVSSEIKPRPESEVFQALRDLSARPGFIYTVAYLSWRDKTIHYLGEISPEALLPTYSRERLIRTEFAVLAGLLVQQPIAFDRIDRERLEADAADVDRLLREMHDALNAPMIAGLRARAAGGAADEVREEGAFLREAIFYAPESAYFFQFRDLAPLRYRQDVEWLTQSKGFTMDQAATVVRAIADTIDDRLPEATSRFIETNEASVLLAAFTIQPTEIAQRTYLNQQLIDQVLQSVTLTTRNESYRAIDDYNETNVFPLIPRDDGSFVVFDTVALYQSLYESPIFWMRADDGYKNRAIEHRGAFTESFSADRLRRVFGGDRVLTNIKLTQGRNTVDEIDVLVIFGDRLIIVQAKSKGLTIEARKGNNLSIRKDFQGAVANAYQQALSCARHIIAKNVSLVREDGSPLELTMPIAEIFPFCVIADHYPSLSNQTRSLLKAETTDVIREPFVMDVFLLDAMTEMLISPLRLLGYVRQRALVFQRVLVDHELTALSFHLKGNLWLDDEFDMVVLGDDIAADLDSAMMVRRLGMPGDDIPEGILTRFRGTPYEQLIFDLEQDEHAVAVELGFLLLTMGLETINGINRAIGMMTMQGRRDPRPRDFTLGLGGNGEGVTFHLNDLPHAQAHALLSAHSALKKFQLKSDKWFGVALDRSGRLRFALAMAEPWKADAEMDAAVAALPESKPAASLAHGLAKLNKLPKLGANDPCPCGSGKKFKKCHMWKQ